MIVTEQQKQALRELIKRASMKKKTERTKPTPQERILATRTGGVSETRTGDTARPVGEILRKAVENL